MHSLCFGIMGGHGNFAFDLVVKLSLELGIGYVSLSKFKVINSVNV
jgi:hypoxanthine-guanine phosphoribosyltransferase